MLEIDYSLVPMGAVDEKFVHDEVARRVQAGEIPPPDRSVNGRLILLNPDPVQTVHQVPDELRPRLRRIMMPAQEGSTHLTAARLYRNITESDERCYLVVIELQSDFRAFSSFIDYLPRLRELYPELAVYLSGTIPDLRDKLAQVLAEGGSTLMLEFDGGERKVEIQSAEAFRRMVTTQQQVISFATPFFTEVRLLLERGGKPIPFNLLTLRKLNGLFGHGDAQEVEVGKGRRERMIIVDLPMPLIRDFRFRQDRGLDFLGVQIAGTTVLSRHFGDEKLEFRWVPMKAVEKFLRRGSGGAQEEIDLSKVGKLRVNTLTGEVSFLFHGEAEQVAVEEASLIAFRKQIAPAARPLGMIGISGAASASGNGHGNGNGSGNGAAREGGNAANDEYLIAFDKYLQPSTHSAHLEPMQEAVRAHFYFKLIGEAVEHTRKQELYAQGMRAAAVGPLAGQTLKLLRRYGLERLIDPKSFFYLCDTPEEVPYFRGTPQRYEQHFANLVEVIREITVGKPNEQVRVSDVAYNMPISMEWVDAGLASLGKVTSPELQAVHREMQMFSDFIAHEFRRTFDQEQEDLTFFEKMQTCRDASLLAKWLSEFKQGSYGEWLPENQHPDVLFFATDEDKQENDDRYYFPSFACTGLFSHEVNKSLFQQFDYEFSVFLEEQIALATHVARENGVLKPGLGEFTAYFKRKMAEAAKEQAELREMLAAIDDENSPIYQQLLKQEEQAYHERYEQFLADQERANNELVETTERVATLVQEIKSSLDLGTHSEAEFFRETPDHPELLEQRILGSASRSQAKQQKGLQAAFGQLVDAIDGWRAMLERFVLALRRTLHFQQAWQSAQETRAAVALRAQLAERASGRMEQLRRMPDAERETLTRRVQTQLRNFQGELEQMTARLAEAQRKNQRTATTLGAYVQSATGRLASLRGLDPGKSPERFVTQSETLRKLLDSVAANANGLAQRMQEMAEGLETLRVRKQRQQQQLFQLSGEHALLRAVAERAEPVLPKVQAPGGKVPTEEEAARLQRAWEEQGRAVAQVQRELASGGQGLAESIQTLRGHVREYQRFEERRESLIKLMARKARLRESVQSLSERRTMMEAELEDLPRRVRQQFMPARKKLLVEVFLPESEARSGQYGKAQSFVTELLGFPHEPLKERYLDQAIYRRFYGRQFMRGGAYAADPKSRMQHPTRNVAPALRLLARALRHNFQLHHLPGVDRVALPTLSNQDPAQILATIKNMAAVAGRGQFDYLVLPPTLDLKDGLALMRRKDELFDGVPRLVLVFITKFDPLLLRRDPEIREAYFRVLKHNVVLNIDGHVVVDNPRSIGMRLLQETLGCAVDIPEVEEPPEVASAAE